MASRTAKLLHVEDDPIEQRVLAHRLGSLADLHFDITTATTESAALRCLDAQPFDVVVLDYQLEEGDGLHLLRAIRGRDALIPVIAISGVATSEVAMDLIQSGADDYFQKGEVVPERLVQSIRVALRRTESVRKRTAAFDAPSEVQVEERILDLCRSYGAVSGTRITQMLDEAEAAWRRAGCDAPHLERIFDAACQKLDAERTFGVFPAGRVVRPLLLEMSLRIAGGQARDTFHGQASVI
ncbi:MAG: response regulator [Planctomycetia bacterium]|nr:response regulator [Planctomycetia bacterium]